VVPEQREKKTTKQEDSDDEIEPNVFASLKELIDEKLLTPGQGVLKVDHQVYSAHSTPLY
jgi:hypothetical protein